MYNKAYSIEVLSQWNAKVPNKLLWFYPNKNPQKPKLTTITFIIPVCHDCREAALVIIINSTMSIPHPHKKNDADCHNCAGMIVWSHEMLKAGQNPKCYG